MMGKVVDASGNGIKDVKIMIDEQEKSVTNKNGMYKIENIEKGMYDIQAVKAHYFFESINMKLDPAQKVIQNIIASEYHLCGKVQTKTNLANR